MWTHQQQLRNRTHCQKIRSWIWLLFCMLPGFFLNPLFFFFFFSVPILDSGAMLVRVYFCKWTHRAVQTVRDARESRDVSRITSNGLHITNRITIHSKWTVRHTLIEWQSDRADQYIVVCGGLLNCMFNNTICLVRERIGKRAPIVWSFSFTGSASVVLFWMGLFSKQYKIVANELWKSLIAVEFMATW